MGGSPLELTLHYFRRRFGGRVLQSPLSFLTLQSPGSGGVLRRMVESR